MTTHADDSTFGPGQPELLDPGEAEVEEWATHERQQRQAWLDGPTAEEKAAWARRERERRMFEREGTLVRGGVRDSWGLLPRPRGMASIPSSCRRAPSSRRPTRSEPVLMHQLRRVQGGSSPRP
jgi:hypothetical protein